LGLYGKKGVTRVCDEPYGAGERVLGLLGRGCKCELGQQRMDSCGFMLTLILFMVLSLCGIILLNTKYYGIPRNTTFGDERMIYTIIQSLLWLIAYIINFSK
jgi:hypothetical protein